MNIDEVWVGKIPAIDETIVYDPAMQLAENDNTYVYSASKKTMVEKSTEFLKQRVVLVEDSSKDQFMLEYNEWKKINGDLFLENEKAEIQLIAKDVARETERAKRWKAIMNNAEMEEYGQYEQGNSDEYDDHDAHANEM